MELNNITNTGTWGQQVTKLNDNFNKVALGIDTLQSAYQSLSQSAIEAVDTLPQTGEANKIYRLVGTTSYSDYMYNTDDLTTPILMATYNNAIDNTPTANSANLVTSGGVAEEFALGAVYDVSAKNPTAGSNNDGKWESISTLLSDANLNTLIPISVRKGGMSVKFVSSSDNKYVQYMYVGKSTADANFIYVANWQKINLEKEVITNSLYNLPVATGQTEPKYYTLAEAIAAVPESERTSIKTIKFRTDSTTVIIAQYQAGDYSSQKWNNLNNWIFVSNKFLNNFINIHKLTGNNTPLSLYDAIRTIPDYARKCGLTIKFRSALGRQTNQWIIETITATFCSTNISDTYFLNEDYWACEYNYNKNNVINLVGKGIRSDGTSGVEKVGDVYYNTGDRTIKKCTAFRSPTDFDQEIVSLEKISKIYFAGVLQDYKDGELTNRYAEKSVHSLINLNKVLGNNTVYTFETALQAFASYFLGRRHLGVTLRYRVSINPSIIVDATYMVGNTDNVYWENPDSWSFRNITNNMPVTRWCAMGDSITEGYYSYFTDESHDIGQMAVDATKTWVSKVSSVTGKVVTNVGIGGTGFVCKGWNSELLNAKELVDTLSFTNIDLVTIAYGINDYKGGFELGSMTDVVGTDNTVVANMRYVIEKIQIAKPTAKIIIILPFNARGYSDSRLGDLSTNYALGYSVNGKTLQDFYDAMVEVCEYYGIQYIDSTHSSVISRYAMTKLLPDGVHPSEGAHMMIAKELSMKISCY